MIASDIIMLMIAACVVLVIITLFADPLKTLIRVAIGSVVGVVGMVAANTLLAPFGVFVGVNLITALIVGVLGIPGFIMLYITSLML